LCLYYTSIFIQSQSYKRNFLMQAKLAGRPRQAEIIERCKGPEWKPKKPMDLRIQGPVATGAFVPYQALPY
jgi:hypothetical protein